ncbi:hypothetical protein F5882DRAFT_158369 [Hyaloscypha sp. PMI_1271]|nr:hypothetical protein F5882DRAFT_158369 [Hyaloscypha sp. PMI_1271]
MAISALPATEYMISFLILSLSSAIERIFFVSSRGRGIMLDELMCCLNSQQANCQVPEGSRSSLDRRSAVSSSSLRRYSWYVLAPVNRGAATSTPHNSCSFGRKIIIKTRICCLRLGTCKDTCVPENFNYCGGIARKSCDPCKNEGPKHTSCTSVGKMITLRLPTAGPLFS